MKIIKATLEDLPEIERLNNKYFKEIRDFKIIIEGKDTLFFVMLEINKICGFSGLHIFRWNNTVRIIDIFIHPDYRRKGYATKFLNRLKKEAKKIDVRTIVAEAPSLNEVLQLYFKNGFRTCGFNDRYYSNDGKEIAIFLSYDLK